MAAPHARPNRSSPDVAARLAEFARACKAATRIVSMYPASHPAIQSALGAHRARPPGRRSSNGPFAITVLPDALLVGGRGLPKPESGGHRAGRAAPPAADRRDDAARHARRRRAGTRSCRCSPRRRKTRARSAAWPRRGTTTGNKSIDAQGDRLRRSPARARRRRRVGVVGPHPRGARRRAGRHDGVDAAAMASMLELADDPERLAQFAATPAGRRQAPAATIRSSSASRCSS